MRIKFISLLKGTASPLNKELPDTIADNISSIGDVKVVDNAPDLVHVFGKWSGTTATTMKGYTHKGIPVVFTSANGLVDVLPPHSLMLAPTVFHCCGPAEAGLIKKLLPKASVKVIANEQFTLTTDRTTMLRQFNDLYAKVYNEHEAKVMSEINNKVRTLNISDHAINEICSQLLYLQYAFRRETIRQRLLDNLSDTLINSNYDEEAMRQALDTLKISPFTASVMALLESNSHLTEGFMPIAASADKTTKQMQKHII